MRIDFLNTFLKRSLGVTPELIFDFQCDTKRKEPDIIWLLQEYLSNYKTMLLIAFSKAESFTPGMAVPSTRIIFTSVNPRKPKIAVR